MRVSSTPRTGTEQILLTEAWDRALGGVDFRPLAGPPVYLDTANLAAVDKSWITFRLRQAMLRQGVRLVDEKPDAQVVVEAGVGVYGTDSRDWFLGIPQTSLLTNPGLGMLPISGTPEVALAKKSSQAGTVRMALFAHERTSGRYLWESGTIDADTDLKQSFYAGLGPFASGSSSLAGRR